MVLLASSSSCSPLPSRSTLSLHDEPNALSAYDVCIELEKEAKCIDLIRARVLGYLLIHATVTARHQVAHEILSCNKVTDSLLELGDAFIKYFIIPFRKYKGRTPASSNHPSRPSFDKLKEQCMESPREAPKTHKEAKRTALVRDGYRCAISGTYDEAAESDPKFDQQVLQNKRVLSTECAHIVPQSTFPNVSNDEGSSEKKDYSASVLAVLRRFGYDVSSLNGDKVHSLYNVMTMEKNVHDWFDRLYLWFEPTTVTDCYRLCSARPLDRLLIPPIPQIVTFTSTRPKEYPVPSSELLALHATCAKVAHLSGASKYIDEVDRDLDDLKVLENDGRSADVFSHALWCSLNTINC